MRQRYQLGRFQRFQKAQQYGGTNTSATLSFQGGRDFSERPITQADLVGPQGQCASAGLAPSATGADGQPNAAPAIAQSGIALQMTECEVVQRAGGPDGIEFGNNAGERNVVLTYTGGARPGIYRFAGGRLYSIERVAEPPAPPKAQKKSAPAKKRPPAPPSGLKTSRHCGFELGAGGKPVVFGAGERVGGVGARLR